MYLGALGAFHKRTFSLTIAMGTLSMLDLMERATPARSLLS